MHRKVKQVLCAIREHSSVSYAKMATVGGFCDINHIIVKATAPDDFPLQEKYIQELVKVFSISSSSSHSFSVSLTRRFAKTRSWRVALKCLLLMHRLIRSLPGCSPFRTELLWARSNGMLCLNPCRFQDDSSSSPEDYTVFVRSYARLLDEAVSCFALEEKKDEDEDEDEEEDEEDEYGEDTYGVQVTLKDKVEEVSRMLELLPQLQSLIDRVMDCMPSGAAARSFIVQSAMKHMIRDSFICYTTFRKEIVLVLDNLFQMPYKSSILAFGIYKKAALQADQLCEFYDWCKAKGLCGAYEYPFIDRIPQIQIHALETFLKGMWQLTDSSSPTTSPSSWVDSNKSSSTEEEDGCGYDRDNNYNNKQIVVGGGVIISTQWEEFEDDHQADVPMMFKASEEEMAPLIQLEDYVDEGSWEALLEASIELPRIPRNDYLIPAPKQPNWSGIRRDGTLLCQEESNQLQMQLYNPYPFNPFCHPENEAPNPFREPLYLNTPRISSSVPWKPWGF